MQFLPVRHAERPLAGLLFLWGSPLSFPPPPFDGVREGWRVEILTWWSDRRGCILPNPLIKKQSGRRLVRGNLLPVVLVAMLHWGEPNAEEY